MRIKTTLKFHLAPVRVRGGFGGRGGGGPLYTVGWTRD
jgi:hypothetical protein